MASIPQTVQVGRWFFVGSRPQLRAALAAAFGKEPMAGTAGDADDLVIVDSLAAAADCAGWPGGHAFAVVRGLKERANAKVYVVVDAEDRLGPQLARFCLADAALAFAPAAGELDLAPLLQAQVVRSRPSIDAMLERLQAELAQAGGSAPAVERLLEFAQADSLATRLQDAETGLFDGAYATMKLDEEWKRARRFHQPLALLLLDLGVDVEAMPAAERQHLLASAAGVFLNECRDIDVLARFAPGTFLFLLPGTGPEGAAVLARRMLAALAERLPAAGGQRPHAGLAVAPAAGLADKKAFLLLAEACLRRAATAAGKDRLCTPQDLDAVWQ